MNSSDGGGIGGDTYNLHKLDTQLDKSHINYQCQNSENYLQVQRASYFEFYSHLRCLKVLYSVLLSYSVDF